MRLQQELRLRDQDEADEKVWTDVVTPGGGPDRFRLVRHPSVKALQWKEGDDGRWIDLVLSDEALHLATISLLERLSAVEVGEDHVDPGWGAFTIDCRSVRDEADFWQRYIDAVRPEGAIVFGRNLDAFWDAISGGGPGWPGECELSFTNTADLSRLRGGQFLAALRTIAGEAGPSVRIVLS